MIDSKSPMPWIGVYAAVASGIWTLLLFADKMHSVRHRKLWFPCRYAALNATFLALMGIAVKLPMDLTTPMPGTYDQAAKRCSIAFLCASTAHVIPSLGSMSAREIIVNLTAVGILKVSHTVDVIIQVLSGVIEDYFQVVVVVIDVYMLFMLISSALTVSTRKMHLEHKYNALHARISAEELQRDEIMVFDKLKYHVKKYWVMAETGDPRLVMARSDDFWVLSLIYAFIFSIDGLELTTNNKPEIASDYKWSVYLVYYAQYAGIGLCTFMSIGRMELAILYILGNIKKYTISSISLEIKSYRINRLVEWKKRLPPSQVRNQKLRNIIYETRNLLLNICIITQIVIVIMNKLLWACLLYLIYLKGVKIQCSYWELIGNLLSSTLFVSVLLQPVTVRWLNMIKNFFSGESKASVNPIESEHRLGYEKDLENYFVLLESEAVQEVHLMFINASINSFITTGAKRQPRCLMKLMEKSTSFEGVLKFESDQVSLIICEEPLNCWSLSVATLTSIMIALPNVQNEEKNLLLRSVMEGFKYVRPIEKSLDVHKKIVNSTSAADFAWGLVEMRHKWLDMDLQEVATVSKSSKETLQNLANRSEEILKKFTSRMNGNAVESSVNLPENIIIANSMYKISNSLLLVYEESYHSASDTQVFERLSVIIADIFAACLTNLPCLILKKCSNSAIEEREKSIEEASYTLGETQGILEALQKREIPNLSLNQSISIDEWRTFLKHTNHGILGPTPSNENIVIASSGEVHLDIQELRASATEEALGTDEGDAESHVSGEVEELEDEEENNQA
ncbi:uncharacterized protein LOC111382722 [Olea europaea var. sylvestris]|uniref:uncharacterized protein LOC111382722 n=1 Tax=Olea europaea var. sylvestris TaxID=158386 RepID=UPI000C1D2DAB|nr:uncharacterized protein LOC111382722 [Olea europaea var. sylvestris]